MKIFNLQTLSYKTFFDCGVRIREGVTSLFWRVIRESEMHVRRGVDWVGLCVRHAVCVLLGTGGAWSLGLPEKPIEGLFVESSERDGLLVQRVSMVQCPQLVQKITKHLQNMENPWQSLHMRRRGHLVEKTLEGFWDRDPREQSFELVRLKASMDPTALLSLVLLEGDCSSKFTITSNLYDYRSDLNPTVWVDFAAHHLGGGLLDYRGFVQEEELVASLPAATGFLMVISPMNVEISSGGKNDPLMIQNIYRCYEIDPPREGYPLGKYYGSGIRDEDPTKPMDQFIQETVIPLNPPRKVDILAMVAESLSSRDLSTQLAPGVVERLYLEIYHGFVLAKRSLCSEGEGKRITICSGKFGCGAFNQNIGVVYLVQRLVAEHLGEDLVLYDFLPQEAELFRRWWDELVPQVRGQSAKIALSKIEKHVRERWEKEARRLYEKDPKKPTEV